MTRVSVYHDVLGNELVRYEEIVNPYFLNLMGQARLCPWCHARTRWRPTLSPNAAYEQCVDREGCGWFYTHVAPSGFEMPEPNAPGNEALRERMLAEARGDPPMGELLEFRPRA